jgi:hypothetical protein
MDGLTTGATVMTTLTEPHAATEKARLTLPPRRGTLTATRLKVSLTLDATEVTAVPAPDGKPRVTLRMRLPDRTITAKIAEKSLRKALGSIAHAGGQETMIGGSGGGRSNAHPMPPRV